MKINKNCIVCSNEFSVAKSEVNRGNGKFCSLKCSGINRTNQSILSHTPNHSCAWCGLKFYRRKSRKFNRSGLNFCSNDHKNQASKLEGGIREVFPSHFGTAVKYRKIAFAQYPSKCNRCGYNKHKPVLQVHHKDGNNKHNDSSNLEILCANCHMEHHLTK